MFLIVIAFIIYSGAIIYRGTLSPEIQVSDPGYWAPLTICLCLNLLAGYGFYLLLNVQPTLGTDYSSAISILSLLTAGLIAGNFSFSHQEVASDEKFLATTLSVLFLFLFYMLLGAVAYYSGLSESIRATPHIEILVPIIMSALLMTNTIYDFWDFLERDE